MIVIIHPPEDPWEGWINLGRGGSLLSDNRRPYPGDPPLIKAAKPTKASIANFHFDPQKRCLSCSVKVSSIAYANRVPNPFCYFLSVFMVAAICQSPDSHGTWGEKDSPVLTIISE
jgi:hypothetical protein